MSGTFFTPLVIIEYLGVVFTILYNVLLVRENIWCWLFAILSSLCGILVLYQKQLFGQVFLYSFYTAMGFYGLWYWRQAKKNNLHIIKWTNSKQAIVFFVGIAATSLTYLGCYYFQSKIGLFDIALTVFSIIATFKETRKVLSGWLYWILLNLLSAYLFLDNGLLGYFALSIVYSLLSVYGYFAWKKIYFTKYEI